MVCVHKDSFLYHQVDMMFSVFSLLGSFENTNKCNVGSVYEIFALGDVNNQEYSENML